MPALPPRPPSRAPRNVGRAAAAYESKLGARGFPNSPQYQEGEKPRRSLKIPDANSGNKYLNVGTSDISETRAKSHTTFNMLPKSVSRGEADDIDWRICKVAWIINQICNAPYLMTLAMCFTIPGSFNTKPLFDSKHVTFFIWSMGLIIVNSWITGYVIFVSSSRTIRNIAWAQGAAFVVMNLSLMMVVHNGTFVDLDRDRIEYIQWNVYYAGPPEVFSQLLLWTSLMGIFSCRKCI